MSPDGQGRPPEFRFFGLTDDDLRKLGYSVGAAGDRGREPEEARPRRRLGTESKRWLVTVLGLAGMAWIAAPSRHLPDAVPAAAPDTVFSSARAMTQLVEVAGQPRPVGSREHERVGRYLEGRLRSLGLEVTEQRSIEASASEEGGALVTASVRNIVGRLPGSASSGPVVLVAPYDGAPLSPAAGPGLGVATVLETVRALSAAAPRRNDLVVAFTDAGALGDLGTAAFLREHEWARDPIAVLTVGSAGGTGPTYLFGEASGEPVVLAAVGGRGGGPGAASTARALGSPRLGGAALEHPRLVSFVAAGAPSTLGQPFDRAERVDERTLQDAGSALFAVSSALADRLPSDIDEPDRTSAWVPAIGVLGFASGNRWLGAAAILLLCAVLGLVLVKARGGRPRAVLAAVGVAAVTVVVAAAAADAMLEWLLARHPERDAVIGGLYRTTPLVLAIVALAATSSVLLHGIARRWIGRDEMVFGALTALVALGLWAVVSAPLSSAAVYAMLVPSAVAAGLVVIAGEWRSSSTLMWSLILLLGLTTVAVTAPALSAASALWTPERAWDLGMLAGAAVLLLTPLFETLRRPRAWLTPLVGLGVTGVAIGLSLPAVVGPVNHPLPTTLVYLADEPVRTPLITATPEEAQDTTRVRTMSGRWLTVPGPGERWARTWAAEPPEPGAVPGLLLLPRESDFVLAGGGPNSELVPPSVDVSWAGGGSSGAGLELQVRSGLGGEMLGVRLDDNARITHVAGHRVAASNGDARTVTHWGLAPGESLVLGVALAPEAFSIGVTIVEHHLRPREILGEYFFQRPDSLIPDASAGSDRVLQRTLLRVAVPETPAQSSTERP